MQFLTIDNVFKKKTIAILAKEGQEIQLLTSNKGLVDIFKLIFEKDPLEVLTSKENTLRKKTILKADPEYLLYIGYQLQPPFGKGTFGTVRVKNVELGLEKLWHIYIGTTPPKDTFRF